jgi:hypothetical protein
MLTVYVPVCLKSDDDFEEFVYFLFPSVFCHAWFHIAHETHVTSSNLYLVEISFKTTAEISSTLSYVFALYNDSS